MRLLGVRALLLLAVVAVCIAAPAAAQDEKAVEDAPIQAFFGTFEGRTLFPMGEQGNRGLRVTVRPFDTFGFTVLWETFIQKGEGGAERKATSVNFRPSPRPGIYEAVFPPGGEPRLMAGDSFTWARVAGKTLTVHVVTIVDGGDYVMQSYDRSLTEGGMRLDFMRIRSGVVERQLKGNLKRVEPVTEDKPKDG